MGHPSGAAGAGDAAAATGAGATTGHLSEFFMTVYALQALLAGRPYTSKETHLEMFGHHPHMAFALHFVHDVSDKHGSEELISTSFTG